MASPKQPYQHIPVPPIILEGVVEIAESPEYQTDLAAFKKAAVEQKTNNDIITKKYKDKESAKTLGEAFPGQTLTPEQKADYLKSLATVPGLQGKVVVMTPAEAEKIKNLKDVVEDGERTINKFVRNKFETKLNHNPALVPPAISLSGKFLRDIDDGKVTTEELKRELKGLPAPGAPKKPDASKAPTGPVALQDVQAGHEPKAPLANLTQAMKSGAKTV